MLTDPKIEVLAKVKYVNVILCDIIYEYTISDDYIYTGTQ